MLFVTNLQYTVVSTFPLNKIVLSTVENQKKIIVHSHTPFHRKTSFNDQVSFFGRKKEIDIDIKIWQLKKQQDISQK